MHQAAGRHIRGETAHRAGREATTAAASTADGLHDEMLRQMISRGLDAGRRVRDHRDEVRARVLCGTRSRSRRGDRLVHRRQRRAGASRARIETRVKGVAVATAATERRVAPRAAPGAAVAATKRAAVQLLEGAAVASTDRRRLAVAATAARRAMRAGLVADRDL